MFNKKELLFAERVEEFFNNSSIEEQKIIKIAFLMQWRYFVKFQDETEKCYENWYKAFVAYFLYNWLYVNYEGEYDIQWLRPLYKNSIEQKFVLKIKELLLKL